MRNMTSRERIRNAIHHREPDRVPLDLGSTSVTGIHAIAYRRLKEMLGVSSGVVRVIDPYQMLADVEGPVKDRLGVDTIRIALPDADRPAGRREDRGVDADHVAVDVEGGAARIALVDRRVDLDVVVIGSGADVAAARRHDAGRHGAAEAERIADRHDPVADARRLVAERDVGKRTQRMSASWWTAK